MTEDPPAAVLAAFPTHYETVRRWSAVAMDPEAWGHLDDETRDAVVALLEAEAEAQDQRAEMPLALVELWAPECDRCDDPTKPTVRLDGKACGRSSATTGRMSRGVTLVHVGPGSRFPLHRCPQCGYEGEHTSQRLAIQDIFDHIGQAQHYLLMGGNRASKSFSGAIAATCCRLGANHPHVREFLARNGLRQGGLPDAPGFVYVVAVTGNDSRNYARPAAGALAPGSDSWLGETGTQDAYLGNPPKPGTLGTAVFKSAEQGAKKMQGASTPMAHQDEDHGDKAVAEELAARCADQGGLSLYTLTPTQGWSPLLRWLLRPDEPRKAGSVVVMHLRSTDNPWVNQDTLRAYLDSLSPRQRDMRMNGEIIALEGKVHADFTRETHVVAAHEIPEGATLCTGVDFGYRDPFVCVWAYLLAGRVHVYRVHYERHRTVTEHGQTITMLEACPHCWTAEDYGSDAWWAARGCEKCKGTGLAEDIHYRWADSADAEGRRTLAREHDLPHQKAVKDRQFGYIALENLLAVGRDGRPGLTISDDPSCAPLIRELEELRWRRATDDARTRAAQMDTEGDDHAWDALRYLVAGLRKCGELAG